MSYWMAVRRRLAAAALAAIDIAALAIAYTGNMTDEIVTMGDGNQYRLLTFTGSGTLTIEKPVIADIWLCGGGANGGSGSGDGGGGGFVNSALTQAVDLITSVVVGGATGTSSFGSIVTANGATGRNGGSGGGAEGRGYAGTGAGVTTYPFGDTVYFSGKPHSAGGAGGGYTNGTTRKGGGNGGSNGSSGGVGIGTSGNPGYGGLLGGGNGGYGSGGSINGKNATFYGSGGGGGAYYRMGDEKESGNGGVGYQGIVYARIPLKQKAA